MDVLLERCAGIDVGKDEVVACVRTPGPGGRGRRKETRTFRSFVGDLEAMSEWFAAEGVTDIAMEATGSYWKPVWFVLEERSFELKLVNAHHFKILPGRKSDVLDAEWIAELLEHGLLRGSFVPPRVIQELRDLTRYRKRLVQTHTSEVQRIQKTLEDAGIKLDSVASHVMGVSGRAMLRALIAGERDPEVLAELARGRLRKKVPELRQALRGRFSEHHALLIEMSLDHVDHLEAAMTRLDEKIDAVFAANTSESGVLSPGPVTDSPPFQGSANGPPRRSSPRSASTWNGSPPPGTSRRGLVSRPATTSPAANAARGAPPTATCGSSTSSPSAHGQPREPETPICPPTSGDSRDASARRRLRPRSRTRSS